MNIKNALLSEGIISQKTTLRLLRSGCAAIKNKSQVFHYVYNKVYINKSQEVVGKTLFSNLPILFS